MARPSPVKVDQPCAEIDDSPQPGLPVSCRSLPLFLALHPRSSKYCATKEHPSAMCGPMGRGSTCRLIVEPRRTPRKRKPRAAVASVGLDGLLDPGRLAGQKFARLCAIACVEPGAPCLPQRGMMDVVLGPGWPGILLHRGHWPTG